MLRMRYCAASGWRALPICPKTDTAWMPRTGLRVPACPHHRLVHLDSSGRWQVQAHCAPGGIVQDSVFLTLPPAMGHFYSRVRPDYAALPPLHPDCLGGENRNPMQLIYPRHHARIYLPVDLQGQPSKTIFRAAHDRENALVHWHLNETYLGSTQRFHTMELAPAPGIHLLTLVDESGNRLEQTFELIARRTDR
jgi:penicillin-binding protein 1C